MLRNLGRPDLAPDFVFDDESFDPLGHGSPRDLVERLNSILLQDWVGRCMTGGPDPDSSCLVNALRSSGSSNPGASTASTSGGGGGGGSVPAATGTVPPANDDFVVASGSLSGLMLEESQGVSLTESTAQPRVPHLEGEPLFSQLLSTLLQLYNVSTVADRAAVSYLTSNCNLNRCLE